MAAMVAPQTDSQTRSFFREVYGWMTLGLGTTGAVAWILSSAPDVLAAMSRNGGLLVLGLTDLAFVWIVSKVTTNSHVAASVAGTLFLIYAAITGGLLSFVFVIYTSTSIAAAFFVTAGTFAAMSLYGYTTGADLTRIGSFALMALVGLIIASLSNVWLRSTGLYWITTYVGVLVFVALTAYDTQKLKALSLVGRADSDEEQKQAIHGALSLYLDFINLFLELLQILGRRR